MIAEHVYIGSGSVAPFLLLMAIAIFFCIHFLPSLIAFAERKRDAFLILILNILFGWTIVIWFILLIWALRSEPERR